MRTIAGMAVGLALFVSIGCENAADRPPVDVAAYRSAVPDRSAVVIGAPRPPVASDAKYFVAVTTATSRIDDQLAAAFGEIDRLTATTPTSNYDQDLVEWDGDEGATLWRLLVWKSGDDKYTYRLVAAPHGDMDLNDAKIVIDGVGYDTTSAMHEDVAFVLDLDALGAATTPASSLGGKLTIGTAASGRTYDLEAPALGWNLTLARDAGAATLDVQGFDRVLFGTLPLPDPRMHVRWNHDGAGRIDGNDSDAFTECWSLAFTRSYYEDAEAIEPTVGAESACAFGPPDAGANGA